MLVRLVLILLLAAIASVAIGAAREGIAQDSGRSMVIKIVGCDRQYQGHYSYVSVVKTHGEERFSGFNLLINYDSDVLTFTSAELGGVLVQSGWKNFTAQIDRGGECVPEGSIKALRLVASIDALGMAAESLPSAMPDSCEIIKIKFYVTNNRMYDCAISPVRFYWQDCRDNTLSSFHGDTSFISRRVFDMPEYERFTDRPRVSDITAEDCRSRVRGGGVCPDCDSSAWINNPARIVDFYNGSINLACSGPIDARGDLNLNGVANEIVDARMLADAILRGPDVLPRLGRAGTIAGSDVNVDGRPMTVADLVFLQRIVIGDAQPYPRLRPLHDTATVEFSQDLFSIKSPVEIGAVLAVFDCDSNCRVKPLTDLVARDFYDSAAGELRILVTCEISINDTARGKGYYERGLPAGENKLFSIHGRAKLKVVQLSDYDGSLVRSNYDPASLPTLSQLFQNAGLTDSAGYLLNPQPGSDSLSSSIMSTEEVNWPHRAEAKIRLNLRDTTDWHIDIYDDRQQLALTYQGRDIGRKTIDVDATSFCPGTYVCALTTGSVTATGSLIRWSSGYNQ
jgi:hypothetical protein